MQFPSIAFRGSGWRGILSDDFTCSNLRRLTRAVAKHLRRERRSRSPRVFVGYDTRFLSEHLAREVASVLAEEGIQPLLASAFTPAPVVSHAVMHGKFDGGINLSASRHPPEYSGLRLSGSNGAPASREVTGAVALLVAEMDGAPAQASIASSIKVLDPWPA